MSSKRDGPGAVARAEAGDGVVSCDRLHPNNTPRRAPTTASLLKAPGLWAKTSTQGRRYLAGIGVLVLENRNRSGEDQPSDYLLLAEAPVKPRAAAQGAQSAPTGSRRGSPAGDASQRPPKRLREGGPWPLDDEMPQ